MAETSRIVNALLGAKLPAFSPKSPLGEKIEQNMFAAGWGYRFDVQVKV